jgi:hypothetical protein
MVINTRLGLEAAAAKEKQRKIRPTPANTFRIMTVSVKAASPLIKMSKINMAEAKGSTRRPR